jgi:hypothetical protein
MEEYPHITVKNKTNERYPPNQQTAEIARNSRIRKIVPRLKRLQIEN